MSLGDIVGAMGLLGLIVIIGIVIRTELQGGSNKTCYKCGKDLEWGKQKKYSIEDDSGKRQNICSTCYALLEREAHK